jgi:hypothetical protein
MDDSSPQNPPSQDPSPPPYSPFNDPFYALAALAQAMLVPTIFLALVCAQCSKKQNAEAPEKSGLRLTPPSLAVPIAR